MLSGPAAADRPDARDWAFARRLARAGSWRSVSWTDDGQLAVGPYMYGPERMDLIIATAKGDR